MTVWAVIVTYNPDHGEMVALLDRLAGSVDRVLIVDNGSGDQVMIKSLLRPGVEILFLGENAGVAAAQNVGLRMALGRDAQFVVLFDHDSLPAGDMVCRLLSAHQELNARGARVAALGPNYRERNTGRHRWPPTGGAPFIEEQRLNSSGCLISNKALRTVGLMREELFIDHVDTEWCLRAADLGWKVYTVRDAHMEHTLGNSARTFMGKNLPYAGPTRFYYALRNSVYMYQRKYPLKWKLADAKTRILMLVVAVLGAYPGSRVENVGMMLNGVVDGLRGRMGRRKAWKAER
jgi:rhamnosyltransferase